MNSENKTKIVAAVKCPDYSPDQVANAVAEIFDLASGNEPIVKPGSTILVKPNLLSPRAPGEAVTTHPVVVKAVVAYCFQAGAGRVWIGDSCAGEHPDERLWEMTGMRQVASDSGAELKSFQTNVEARTCGNTQVPVPASLAEVDAWISVPKLKTHTLTVLTCAVKNTYGMVSGSVKSYYHGQYTSPHSMSRFLLQVHEALRPAFIVVDAVTAMEGSGPANGDPVSVGLLMGGSDALAVDTVCAPVFKSRPRQIPTLRAAMDRDPACLDNIVIRGDGTRILADARLKPSLGRFLQRLPEATFQLATAILACHPQINADKCVGCGVCAKICSQNAITQVPGARKYTVDKKRCIICMCCAEACPYNAVEVKSPLRFLRGGRRSK